MPCQFWWGSFWQRFRSFRSLDHTWPADWGQVLGPMRANWLHSYTGSFKLVTVGEFTPWRSTNTTNQGYFTQKVGCSTCSSTPRLQAEDHRAPHAAESRAEEWTGQQGLDTLAESNVQTSENKSPPPRITEGLSTQSFSRTAQKSSNDNVYLHWLEVSMCC